MTAAHSAAATLTPPGVPAELTLAGHRLRAISVGGVETCHALPALDVVFDIGRCPPGAERQGTLLLTHGHMDHAAGVPYYAAARSFAGLPAPRVICPGRAAPALQAVVEAFAALDGDAARCTITAARAGVDVPLGKGAFARPFRSLHRVQTLGYTVFSTKRKLRSDLTGLDQRAVAARAKAGEVVTEVVETPEVCFPGDTRIEVVDREPAVRRARLLLLECTYLGDTAPREAARRGHVHLDQIAERADLFENEAILLTHFSRRYDVAAIVAAVDRLPAVLRGRVHVLLAGRG